MVEDTLDAAELLSTAGSGEPAELIQMGVSAARSGGFERGLIFLSEAYRLLQGDAAKFSPVALSSYGLCLAKHKGRIKEAAEFCQLAIEREFYNPEHYGNMAKVWIQGRARRKAVDAIERGLQIDPGNKALRKLREEIGVRRRPVIPFLHRDNPLNISLGRMRHRIREKRQEKSRV
ncbi:MAG: hypothetical protein IT186_04050 [Acidobacteria bacterium]|nr:hypothetical protein [Acidobacteriota bacterium]MCG3194064.1 hypothetical protein [Thermoanaerobaculia bacterium]MCK6682711.1 hypothetical protein [Thermoanaerobaculia bacterium]